MNHSCKTDSQALFEVRTRVNSLNASMNEHGYAEPRFTLCMLILSENKMRGVVMEFPDLTG